METRLVRYAPGTPPEEIAALGRLLRGGELVAFPTETVYGIAAAHGDAEAVRRLRDLKGRDAEHHFTVHLADRADLWAPASAAAARIADRLWPGPVTLVLPDGTGTTGFRVPDHEAGRALFRAAGRPVVGTSANFTGGPPAVDADEVIRQFSGRIAGILAAGRARLGAASTVVRVAGRRLEFLRDGALSRDEVRDASCLTTLFVCTANRCRSPMAEGILKHRLARDLGVPPTDLPGAGLLVHSAGTMAGDGAAATPAAVAAAFGEQADIRRHRARSLTPTMLARADLILVAERRHAAIIAEFDPAAAERTETILPGNRDLPDPYGRDGAAYAEAAKQIAAAAGGMAERLLARLRDE